MRWTAMHWTVFALLLIIALLVLAVIYQADRAARAERQGAFRPTVRQRRQWKRERLDLATEGRENRRLR